MGLTDLFSKLIVEHGSAEVQAKHIALFKDQLALADKKISELETENTSLKSQFEKAETTIRKLTKDNEELRSKIQTYEQPTNQSPHINLLEQIKVDILIHMSKYEETYVQSIANVLKIGPQAALSHLEDLSDLEMVDHSISLGGGENHWYLRKEGRKYLVKNGLIA